MRKSYAIHLNPGAKSYFRGGAGLIGTAEDYLKFAQMIANGGEFNGRRYLSKKTVEFMLSNHTDGMGGTTIATTGPGYGFGLAGPCGSTRGWAMRRVPKAMRCGRASGAPASGSIARRDWLAS